MKHRIKIVFVLLCAFRSISCVIAKVTEYTGEELHDSGISKRSVIEPIQNQTDPPTLWNNLKQSNGMYRIPYTMSDHLDNRTRKNLDRAIISLFSHTCIQFDPAQVGDTYLVHFENSSGCTMFLGREKDINTIRGCSALGDMLNAFMRALGFKSETIRTDRDDYVIVFEERMRADKVKLARKELTVVEERFNFTYDMHSVTHFSDFQYAAGEKPTVYYVSTGRQVVKNVWSFSLGDLERVRALYDCNGTAGAQITTDCYQLVDRGLLYRGNVSYTESGHKCQKWRSQQPHEHDQKPMKLTASALDLDHCRNPNLRDRPWCFTTNSSVRWEYCNITVCGTTETLPVPTPVPISRGFWGPWSSYSRCSRTCGDGYMYRVRLCIGAESGSEACPGDYWESFECNYGNCSDTHEWQGWSFWSECTAECDNGTHTRVRQCSGFVGVDQCVGDSVENSSCFSGRTCPRYEDGDCYSYSDPLAYRGTVNVNRYGVTCLNWTDAKIVVDDFPTADLRENHCRNPDNRRKIPYCFIARNKRSPCNVTFCNRRAQWGRWRQWSACSSSCGEGLMTRTRVCQRGHYGEGTCIGDVTMTGVCNITCDANGTPYEPDDVETAPIAPEPLVTTPPSGRECVDFRNPRSYRGTENRTKSGYPCQAWDAVYPWPHNYSNPILIAEAGLTENYCRTPDPDDSVPWCFVMKVYPIREDCSIRTCPYTTEKRPYFMHLWSSYIDKFGIDSELEK